jgi:hypothetical protein
MEKGLHSHGIAMNLFQTIQPESVLVLKNARYDLVMDGSARRVVIEDFITLGIEAESIAKIVIVRVSSHVKTLLSNCS